MTAREDEKRRRFMDAYGMSRRKQLAAQASHVDRSTFQEATSELIEAVVRGREATGFPQLASSYGWVGSVRVKVTVRIDNDGRIDFEVST